METTGWVGLAGVVSNIGFAATVGWYLLTKAIPKMQTDFSAELQANRTAAADLVKEMRTEHRDALRVVIEHCERESERRDQSFTTDMGMVQKAIGDGREVLEEVRDALRVLRPVRNTR